jgi:hypothetical protein
MTNRFDNIFGDLAVRLIDNTFGTTATLRKVARAYDSVAGSNTETVTDYEIKVTPRTRGGVGIQQGSRVERFDGLTETEISYTSTAARTLPAGIVPVIGDRLLYDGIDFAVIAVNITFSGDDAAVYQMELRP